MKFAYKFVAFLFIALSIVIVTNIVSLRFFSEKYFAEYVTEVKKETPDVNLDLVGSVITAKNLDEATLEEYRTTIRDLGNISVSLERFSRDPKAYTPVPTSTATGGLSTLLGREFFLGTTSSLLAKALSFWAFGTSTPEGLFAFRVLRAVALSNLAVITLVVIAGWIWVTLVFRPIRELATRIDGIASRKDYSLIPYKKNDEFRPLLVAINELSRNLAFQEKIRSDFLSDLSHEIKTPITAIKCFLEGMQDGVIPLDIKNTKMLFNEVERLIKITNTVMEIEKTEGKQMADLRMVRFDVIEVLDEIVTEYTPMLAERLQNVEYRSDRRFFVVMDKDAFIQVLHNIFSNFVKYAGKSTTLSIRLSHIVGYAQMVFEDDGRGVADKDIPFLREKFFQAERSRTYTPEKGMGIGLSVVEKIARLHRGAVEIESGDKKGFRLKFLVAR